MDTGSFIPCAGRVWLQCRSDTIVVPAKELAQWRVKFGTVRTSDARSGGVSLAVADLAPCAWGELECHFVIDSSTPNAVGPKTHDEHGPSNRSTWALFADKAMVYKSVRHNGQVKTELSWYGHGGYDPQKPEISAAERALVEYDPEFPGIILL